MPVAFQPTSDTFNSNNAGSATSFSISVFPASTSAVNQVVIAYLQLQPIGANPTSVAMTYGGQAMTLLTSANSPNAPSSVYYVFGRVIGNTTATGTVQATWTNACRVALWGGIFNNVKQTSIAAAATGATSVSGSSNTGDVTIACGDGDMIVGACISSSSSATADTECQASTTCVTSFRETIACAPNPSLGNTSNTIHFTVSPSANFVTQAVNLVSDSVLQNLGTANNLAVGSPTFGTPLSGRAYPVTSLTVGPPTFSAPAFTSTAPPGVNFDVKSPGAGFIVSGTDPFISTPITVGAGANRALLVGLTCPSAKGVDYSAGLILRWDFAGASQLMTLLGFDAATGLYLYGLLNPNAGIKQLRVEGWGGAGASVAVSAISFTGVVQTSAAAAFTNFTKTTGTITNGSVTVATNVNDMVAAIYNGNVATVDQNQWWIDDGTTGAGGGNYARSTSTSRTLSATSTSGRGNVVALGINLVQIITATPIVATSLAVAPPAFDQPVFAQKHVLPSPIGFTVFPPDVTASVLAQVHVMSANGLATSPPTLGGPSITTVHTLIANALAVAPLTLGQGAFSQSGIFSAVGFAVSPPAFAAPVLAQKQVFAANALATSALTFGAPVASVTSLLSANGFAVAPPTFGQPVLKDVINATANDLAVGALTITTAAIAQKQVLAANALAIPALALGTPSMVQAATLTATSLAVQPLTFGQPALGQKHALVGAWAPASPVLGAAVMTVPTVVMFVSKLNFGGLPVIENLTADPYDMLTGMTVGSGTDRALLVAITVAGVKGTDYANYLTVTWDYGSSNQQMTLIGSKVASNLNIILYGLVNPASGSRTLRVQGSGGTAKYSIAAIAFNNVRQASVATAFANYTVASDITTLATVTVPCADGDMVAALFSVPLGPGFVSPIEWWHGTTVTSLAAGNYTVGASPSKTLTVNQNDAGVWDAIGVDVVLSVINVPITASGFSVGIPSFSAPVMVVPKQFFANSFAVSPPTFTAPAFSQNNVFAATALADSPPTFGTPAIGQKQVLPLASSFAVSALALGTPGLFIARVFAAPPAFSTGDLTFGEPALGQKYVFAAGYVPVQPGIGVPDLVQKHVLPAATALAVSAPTVPAAPFGAGRLIAAQGLALSALALAPGALAQTHALVASGLTVSAPVPAVVPFGLQRILTALSVVVGSPTFLPPPGIDKTAFLTAPALVLGAPDFGEAPGVGEILPPLVWPLIRLKRWSNDPGSEFYDDDHSQNEGPVKQAIFANLNDDFEFTISQLSLVGRTSGGRGPAETIQAVDPLYLFDRKLFIDWSDVELLQSAMLAEIEDRTDAVANEAATRTAIDNGIIAAINALSDSITTAIGSNSAAIAANTAAIAANTAAIVTLGRDIEGLRRIGVAPAPAWRNMIARDLVAGTPALGTPLLGVH